MPFTPVHALAVAPLARFRKVLLEAAVLGSLASDVPLFTAAAPHYTLTHSPRLGVLYTLPYGILAFLWLRWARGPLISLLPASARTRLTVFARTDLPATPLSWLGWLLAFVVGLYTHIVWDSFTHLQGFGVQQIAILQRAWLQVGLRTLYGYQVLQHGFGLVGVPILAWVVWRWYRDLRPSTSVIAPAPLYCRVLTSCGLLLVAPCLALRTAALQSPTWLSEWFAYLLVTHLISIQLVCLGLAALLIRLVARPKIWVAGHWQE